MAFSMICPIELRRLVSALVLIMLVAPGPILAVPVRKGTIHRTSSKPVVADDTVIPLPLTPTVPVAQRVCISRTPSGLGYTILRSAAGPKPTSGETVLINYVGYLAATGTVFDQGMRSPLPVNGVIPGFSQGLQMLARSGIVRLCIPAAMGYGTQASGPIPANADLVFQVELLDFKTAAEIDAMQKAQPADGTPNNGATPPSQQ